MTSIQIEPLPDAPFGALVAGVEPGSITDTDRGLLWDTYRANGLLCLTFDRMIEAHELHALTSVFGANEYAPGMIRGIGRGAVAGEEGLSPSEQEAQWRAKGIDPYLTYLGNVERHSGERADVDPKFYGEWEWHTDMSYIEVPPTFSLLHARRVPDEGGDTWFASQVLAATELPDDLRQQVADRTIKHDSTYGSSGILRPGMTPPASPIEAVGHPHPVLRTVPSTGDEALFLGRRTNGYVVGMPLEESERLLDALWAHATQPRFCYRHRWTPGEVVVWDNRMMLHKRDPVANGDIRLMWRTQTRGEAVIPAPAHV